MCLMLTGCEPYFEGPTGPIKQETRLVSVTVHDSYAELARHPLAPEVETILKGFAIWDTPVCQVHYVHNDYETFIHEMKHCYYGAWHD